MSSSRRTPPKPGAPNKTRAIALKYDGNDLPQVVASGQGLVAAQIIDRAQNADIPLREDPALAQALSQLDLGEHIPEALFRAVAEVLSYALYVSGKHEEVLRTARQHQHRTSEENARKDNPRDEGIS
ncbi:MAG: EscU/YscU/HrcU family type III secretion system export apparatus switch protein [Halothiobacillus sp.]|jgi:flagellar biosynthesis protein|uniref:EscU/YscU/HrcU family type III secretion system export apparatus switch protein n=1 Tax=Halothiobacillus sp. TaxID=1891311 RepID=UPI002AD2F3D9|nr:EscU/YscU/HrcU family type III secretion system export apparatus switch protein [Halothiobacillus sp.]MDA3876316.1 EscU/YscU/HrcU family type III secretion system export apparatus switch protein [Halothiobacillus sp.]